MSVFSIMPGTDTKVTPDMEAPTIPKATMYQGDRRSALKKMELVDLRAVSRLNISRQQKYIKTVRSINIGAKVAGFRQADKSIHI
uniref:Uncharacterized protein n=1 Tax=Prevotella sp. GTC17262 TaxID=3236797 RepID=A0AB33JQ53_9BACT